MTPLAHKGTPLFFKVGHPAGLDMPQARLGDAIRTFARALPGSAFQKEALVASSRTGQVWRVASDEGAYLEGSDIAPCPLSFLSVGMISSYMNEIVALASSRDVRIRDIRLTQDNYYTMEGSIARGTMTGGALPVELAVEIDCSADEAALNDLVLSAIAASPLNGLMRAQHTSLFTLSRNGRPLEPKRVKPIGRPPLREAWDAFEAARPEAGVDASGVIVRNGMSPKTEEATSSQGSSLAEHQSRRLHVQAECTLRADGVKQIRQSLYNPWGSVFHFLSDEAPVNGGRGMAPDANSYISAGIAFCFMTQTGRYARILKKGLQELSVIQDTHFSLGGASGGTGQPGTADPVETHLYLQTREDDNFARDALDMSEQTCFLHAFCRTDLKTRIRVTPRAAKAS
jgi:hypothetical protein